MPFQYPENHVINQSTKRRMHDDEEDNDITTTRDQGTTTKRLNDLSQQFNPNNAPPKPEITLPSLTFASPDYRPPPRPDALWLQPVPSSTSTPMMEDDSTDEDDVLPNPSYNNTLTEKQQTTTTNGFEWVMTD